MTWTNDIRRKARAKRLALGHGLDAVVSAMEVLASLKQETGFTREALPYSDPVLMGALALPDREYEAIFEDETLPPEERHCNAAHEFAHLFLHDADAGYELLDLADAEPIPLSGGKVEGYSPRQRREAEANVHAAELLLPGPLSRHLFLEERLPARAIAAALGLPPRVVHA